MSAEKINAYIAALPKWQQDNLIRFRKAVGKVAPAAAEGWKWDVPVFLLNGTLVCAMSAFAKHTKYNFFAGAALADPDQLFNSGLESKKSRSINLAEGEAVNIRSVERMIAGAFVVAAAPKR